MQKSSPGMTAIEVIIVLVVLTFVLAVYLLKGAAGNFTAVRVTAIVTHMKLVGNMVENQKRHLGYYPLNLGAMENLPDYLAQNGNSSLGPLTEESLRNPWNGPYIKGVATGLAVSGSQRRRYINLEELIAPGVRGYLQFSPYNDLRGTHYHYSIYASTPAGTRLLEKIGDKIINKCNKEKDVVRIKTAPGKDFFAPNPYQPCGYRSIHGQINRIHYNLR